MPCLSCLLHFYLYRNATYDCLQQLRERRVGISEWFVQHHSVSTGPRTRSIITISFWGNRRKGNNIYFHDSNDNNYRNNNKAFFCLYTIFLCVSFTNANTYTNTSISIACATCLLACLSLTRCFSTTYIYRSLVCVCCSTQWQLKKIRKRKIKPSPLHCSPPPLRRWQHHHHRC